MLGSTMKIPLLVSSLLQIRMRIFPSTTASLCLVCAAAVALLSPATHVKADDQVYAKTSYSLVVPTPASATPEEAMAILGRLDPLWLEKVRGLDRAAVQGALTPKMVAMVRLITNLSVTHMHGPNTERYMREAVAAGASKAELLATIKLASVLGIHSYALSAPEIRKAMASQGIESPSRPHGPTPATDAFKKSGAMNAAWGDIERWDADWLEAYVRTASAPWTDGVLDTKTIELLCIAGDAAVTHLWAPGVLRHAEAAFKIGVTPDEIFEVLRIVSVQGSESIEFALPILEALSPGKP